MSENNNFAKHRSSVSNPLVNIARADSVSTPTPDSHSVPTPKVAVTPDASKPESSAFYFFIFLVLFFALGFLAWGEGAIIFQIINKNFPDTLSYYGDYHSQEAVKLGFASLVIAGPLYFWLSFLVVKHLFLGKMSEESKTRKWLTYIVLFLAAATVIGDLIVLLFGFLNGELTMRFGLKALTILIIAGGVLGYHFWNIRAEGLQGNEVFLTKNKLILRILMAVSVVVFLISFLIIDLPKETRAKRMDEEKIDILSSASGAIQGHFDQYGKIPTDIEELKGEDYLRNNLKRKEITYKKIDLVNYQLCAEFEMESQKEEMDSYSNPYSREADWQHPAGSICFDREVIQKEIPETGEAQDVDQEMLPALPENSSTPEPTEELVVPSAG